MQNKEGTGAIFKNTSKKSEKSPDYNGSITVDGKVIKFSCWIKKSMSGTTYMSVAVDKGVGQKNTPTNEIKDETIPF